MRCQTPDVSTIRAMDRDLEHLRLLSIFYYIFAGLSVLGSCCGLFYVGIGIAMASDTRFFEPTGQQGPPPEAVKWMMTIMGGFIFCLAWVVAVASFLVARSLSKRKWYVFCL